MLAAHWPTICGHELRQSSGQRDGFYSQANGNSWIPIPVLQRTPVHANVFIRDRGVYFESRACGVPEVPPVEVSWGAATASLIPGDLSSF